MTRLLPSIVAVACVCAPAVRAEVKEIRAAQQFGLSYLALMIMEDQKLVEKHAKELGLSELKVSWIRLAGPAAMNDALLSGELDYGTGGAAALITLWSKTRGTPREVRGVAALNTFPNVLVTNNPKVKTIRDFQDGDRIAVTAVKTANQALLLEMAAAKVFGDKEYARLDPLTITMSHADAMAALLSGNKEVTAHFGASPFQEIELEAGGPLHKVIDSEEILGGPGTFTYIWASTKFRQNNPKAYAAFFAALEDATAQIMHDRRAAAETYLRLAQTKEPIEQIRKVIENPKIEYTLTPQKSGRFAEFMCRVGRIPLAPAVWKDLFFDEVHARPGD